MKSTKSEKCENKNVFKNIIFNLTKENILMSRLKRRQAKFKMLLFLSEKTDFDFAWH